MKYNIYYINIDDFKFAIDPYFKDIELINYKPNENINSIPAKTVFKFIEIEDLNSFYTKNKILLCRSLSF